MPGSIHGYQYFQGVNAGLEEQLARIEQQAMTLRDRAVDEMRRVRPRIEMITPTPEPLRSRRPR